MADRWYLSEDLSTLRDTLLRAQKAEAQVAFQKDFMPARGGSNRAERRRMLTQLVTEHATELGVTHCCEALGVPRASYYCWRTPKYGPHRRRKVPRALSESEQQVVLDTLRSERFCDQAPAQVVATLLDEERYLCSTRTMYRLLRTHGEVRERRDQLRHPSYARPELLATAPNQLWLWDISAPPQAAPILGLELRIVRSPIAEHRV